jgi:hypothetical protein
MNAAPGPEPQLFDAANPLLVSGLPSQLVTGVVATSDGVAGIATIRTPDTTLHVTLTKEQATEWAAKLASLRDSLSGTKLIVASATSPIARMP